MEYRMPNVSLMTSPRVIYDEQGLDLPPWETMNISHVLLPALCAIFITVVIVVIACCLIQKKSKSSGGLRQKSCHTIETIPEASDLDIYDVIEEVRASRFTPDKYLRRHDSSVIASHQTKLGSLFANSSSNLSFVGNSKFDLLTSKMVRNSKEMARNSMGSVTNEARLSANTDGGVSNVYGGDDGIYETLDRHCTLKNELHETGSSLNVDKKLAYQQKTDDFRERFINSYHEQSNIIDNEIVREISEELNCQRSISKEKCKDSEALSSEKKETTKLVCQISVFQITDSEEQPALIETSYYQVQSHSSVLPGNTLENVPEVFQNSDLRIIHNGIQEKNPTDLVLKHMENGVFKHTLPETPCNKNSLTDLTTTKSNKIPHKVTSKRYPTLIMKKAKSFRYANKEKNNSKEQYRTPRRKSDSSDADTLCDRTPSKQANIPAGPETTRILTKLGPLPPLPVQSQATKDKAFPKKNPDKTSESAENEASSLKTYEPFITFPSPGTSLQLPSFSMAPETRPIKLNPIIQIDSTSTKDDIDNKTTVKSCQTFRDNITVSAVTYKSDPQNSNLSTGLSKLSTQLSSISQGNVCSLRKESVCGSTPNSGRNSQGSNIYFVLESHDGSSISSRSSGVYDVNKKEVVVSQNDALETQMNYNK